MNKVYFKYFQKYKNNYKIFTINKKYNYLKKLKENILIFFIIININQIYTNNYF